MIRALAVLFAVLFVAYALPLGVFAAIWLREERPASWREADWSSARLLPAPRADPAASIRVLAARTGGLKGIVAVHSWLVLKKAGADRYDRYDVVGWGNPVRRNSYPADGRWYSNDPEIVFELKGARAEALLPKLAGAIEAYRFSRHGDYRIWPGPNSNTFVAAVLAAVPELGARLPPTAVGRDFPAGDTWLGRSPAGGWTLSLGGFLGVTIGWREGLEVHLLGLTAGIEVLDPAFILPGFGRVPLLRPPSPVGA
jgi:hypothetical protein